MSNEQLISDWFQKWVDGDFRHLPVTDDFVHTSPFGTIESKKAYLELVEKNQDKFLGYEFFVHDELYTEDCACVRYTARQGEDFSLDVCEWYYFRNGLICEIIAYYHIGEIREERNMDG